MTVFEGEVLVRHPYVVDMDDEEAAEYEMLVIAKEDFPEGAGFSVSSIKEVKSGS